MIEKILKNPLFLIIFLLLLFSLSIGGFFLGAFIYIANQDFLIKKLENYRPALITRVYDYTGKNLIAEFYDEYRETRPLVQMPKNLINAFLCAEDENFFKHIGINPVRILIALYKDITAGRIKQGASTITQQLAKNLLAGKQRTIKRKVREMLISFEIEKHYSKEQILEMYLNYIFLGDKTHNAHGVQSAAKAYFGKNVEDLTLSECAILAGMPKAPNYYSPARNPTACLRRRNWILKRMFLKGFISKKEYKKALNEKIKLAKYKPFKSKAPYFVEYVKQKLLKDPKIGYEGLFCRGLKIKTTIDLDIQAITESVLREKLPEIEKKWQENRNKLGKKLWNEKDKLKEGDTHLVQIDKINWAKHILYAKWMDFYGKVSLPDDLPYHNPSKIIKQGNFINVNIVTLDLKNKKFYAELADKHYLQGAVIVLDTHTGAIRAMCGGYDYYDDKNNGQWNRCVQAYRQVGSCIKPIFFAAALQELKFTAATVIIDEPIVYIYKDKKWAPQNYEHRFFGPTILQEALEHSRNIIAIKLVRMLGIRDAIRWLNDFGIKSNRRRKIPYNLTIALGSVEVSPLEIANAYIPFANNGIFIKAKFYDYIKDMNGELIEKSHQVGRIVLSKENAYIMTSMLKGVIDRGTGYGTIGAYWPANYPEIAGKTGTTDNCTEAWFVGYSPDYLVAVYVAFDEKISLGNKMSGGKVAGPIWRDIMKKIYAKKGIKYKKFPVPDDIVFRDICTESGELACKGCYRAWRALVSDSNYSDDMDFYVIKHVAFIKGTEPKTICHLHSDW